MKHAFTTHSEIAHQFISGKFDGSAKYCRNASTDGRAFWSYSTCIAQKCGNFVVLDSYFYSRTTAKQKSEIRAAANDRFIIVELPQIFRLAAAENIEFLSAKLKEADAKLRRARTTRSRLHWSDVRAKYISYWGYMPALLRAAGYPETSAAAYRQNWREVK